MPYMDNKNADRLINTYADMILRISYMYLKHTYDAEDICQEIFLKLLSGEYIFNSPAHEKSWIIRTTINACKDHLRTTESDNGHPCGNPRSECTRIRTAGSGDGPSQKLPCQHLSSLLRRLSGKRNRCHVREIRKCHFNIPAARKTEATSNA